MDPAGDVTSVTPCAVKGQCPTIKTKEDVTPFSSRMLKRILLWPRGRLPRVLSFAVSPSPFVLPVRPPLLLILCSFFPPHMFSQSSRNWVSKMLCSAEGNKSHTGKDKGAELLVWLYYYSFIFLWSGILQTNLELTAWSSNEAEHIGKAPHMQDT